MLDGQSQKDEWLPGLRSVRPLSSLIRLLRRWIIYSSIASTLGESRLGSRSKLDIVQPTQNESTALHLCLTERKQLPKDLRRGFFALFLLVSWMMWKERNSWVFERFATMPAWMLPKINEVANLWVAAGFRRLAPLVAAWSQYILFLYFLLRPAPFSISF